MGDLYTDVLTKSFCYSDAQKCERFRGQGPVRCTKRNAHLPTILHQGSCGSAKVAGREGTITSLGPDLKPLSRSRFIPRT